MGKADTSSVSLPLLDLDDKRKAGTKAGRIRAIVLVVVHLAILAHVIHYLQSGSTMTPLEPSEASFTITTGEINAGALLLLLSIFATAIVGRFFCGWMCHLVAYQDAARWVLVKLGWRPKPLRSRLLMLVPLFTALWLYGIPVYQRMQSKAAADWNLELATDSFWYTFPGLGISIITIVVCGLLIIVLLGSKGFCSYGCPYGAFFNVADRIAPGRIRVNEDCTHVGDCTRNCSSNINVAREVAMHGMVVDPGCMKCMDCVAGCPNDALHFGFTKKVEREKKSRRRSSWDFTWTEEIGAAIVFGLCFWVYYFLYGRVPLLLAVGIAVMIAALCIPLSRLLRGKDVTMQRLRCRVKGKMTVGGIGFALIMTLVFVFTGHGAVMQWHKIKAWNAYDAAGEAYYVENDSAAFDAQAAVAIEHLDVLSSWGIIATRGQHVRLGELRRWQGDHEGALTHFDRAIDQPKVDGDAYLYRAMTLLALGRSADAMGDLDLAFGRRVSLNRYRRFDIDMRRLKASALSQQTRSQLLEVWRDVVVRGHEAAPWDFDLASRACKFLTRGPSQSLRDPKLALAIAKKTAEESLGAQAIELYGGMSAINASREDAEHAASLAEANGFADVKLMIDEMISDM